MASLTAAVAGEQDVQAEKKGAVLPPHSYNGTMPANVIKLCAVGDGAAIVSQCQKNLMSQSTHLPCPYFPTSSPLP
jgi:hypothetical protein